MLFDMCYQTVVNMVSSTLNLNKTEKTETELLPQWNENQIKQNQ